MWLLTASYLILDMHAMKNGALYYIHVFWVGYFFHAEPANQFYYAKFETEKEDKKNPSEGMYIYIVSYMQHMILSMGLRNICMSPRKVISKSFETDVFGLADYSF